MKRIVNIEVRNALYVLKMTLPRQYLVGYTSRRKSLNILRRAGYDEELIQSIRIDKLGRKRKERLSSGRRHVI